MKKRKKISRRDMDEYLCFRGEIKLGGDHAALPGMPGVSTVFAARRGNLGGLGDWLIYCIRGSSR